MAPDGQSVQVPLAGFSGFAVTLSTSVPSTSKMNPENIARSVLAANMSFKSLSGNRFLTRSLSRAPGHGNETAKRRKKSTLT